MKALLPALAALPLLGAASVTAGVAPGRCGDTYNVARNDTLYSIARRCRGSVAELMALNRISDPRRLEIGQRLVLAGRPGAGAKPHGEADVPRGHGLAYAMRGGDTLYSLARWSRVSLRALLAANPGIDPHEIEIGDPVRLPRGAVDPDAARLRERGPPQARAPMPPQADDDEAGKPDGADEPADDLDDEPEDGPEGM
jgi:LysM repeat protein